MLRAYLKYIHNTHIRVTNNSAYGYLSDNTIIEPPIFLTNPALVYLKSCKIRSGFTLINYTGKFVVKNTVQLQQTVLL
jgi:hypothetical protein